MHPILAVLLGLGLILGLARFKLPLGVGFLLGAVCVGLLGGLGGAGTFQAFVGLLQSQETWIFSLAVVLVFLLSSSLRRAGSLELLMRASARLLKNRRLRVASMPALVGLLPMPGGAVVSAPLVESSSEELALSPAQKNLINYWFRHIWELCWPLYPSLLLAASLLGSPVIFLCAAQLPLSLLVVGLGRVFLLRSIPKGNGPPPGTLPSKGPLVSALMPLLVTLGAMPLLGVLLAPILPAGSAGVGGLAGALLLGLLVLLTLRGPRPMLGACLEGRTWSLLALALGVKIFGGFVTATGAAGEGAALLIQKGVPPWAALMSLPFFLGLVSGNTLVVVTVAFPVLQALGHGGLSSPPSVLPGFVLAYSMGFVGYMLSPVHLCLVLSSRFFEEPLHRAYGQIFWPLLIFAAGAVSFSALMARLVS